MKLLFYIDSMQKGGANRVMANLTGFFANSGYDVVLVNDILSENRDLEYPLNPLVKRVILDVQNTSRAFSNLKRIAKLRELIKTENPECVISFMGPPNIRMLLASAFLKCRTVVSVRNDPTKEYGTSWVKQLIANVVFLLADGCVFQTEDAALYFNRWVRRKSKVIVNPVNESFYGVKRSDTPRNIVTVGRLYPQKNHKLLIDAFAKIADDFPEENLIIYGEGPLREEMEKQIADLQLTNRIFLPGSTSRVPEVLSEAKLFVLSSDFEGMPNALMEAMAVGVPVISTDCPCGGPRSLVESESQGQLVPSGDAIALSNCMTAILSSQKLQQELSIGAKKRAYDFLPECVFRQWEGFVCRKS